MIKVFYVIDNLQKGGKERRLSELLRYWEDNYDVESTLILLRDKVEYLDVHHFSKTKIIILKRRIKKDPLVLFKLWKICRKIKPDIIHTWGSQPAVYMCLIAFLQRIPLYNSIIVNAKCDVFSKDWIRSLISFPFSTRILGNSVAGLEAYKVKKSKGVLIYNGYNYNRNLNLIDPATLKQKFNIKTNFIVGMVGSFHPRKDYITFIQAAAEIHKFNQEITFVCIGDGEMLDDMKMLNESINQHNKKFLFLGKQNEIESLIQLFNIGVLLTNTKIHLEGISNSIIEYMAQGKPVIATRGGGTNELVIENETGFLIEYNDVKKLVELIIKLYNNDPLRMILGKNGMKRIHEDFSINQMAGKTYNCYKEVLKKGVK